MQLKPKPKRPVIKPKLPDIASLSEQEAWRELEQAQLAIANARNKHEANAATARLKTINTYLRELGRRSFYFTLAMTTREFLPEDVFARIENFAKQTHSEVR